MDAVGTRLTITGTGTPIPVPGRAGAGVLVQAPGTSLQFDAGRGTVLRLADAGVAAGEIDAVFITHHHSDHTSDLFDLLHTAWVLAPNKDLDVVVPQGPTERFASKVLVPFDEDIAVRLLNRGGGPDLTPNVIAFAPSDTPHRVWSSSSARVDSVRVHHEPVEGAVGYRVDTSDGRIVISGDTRACLEIELLAQDADVLVHEVAMPELAPERMHVADYHTTAASLGALASRAGVRTLVLTHLWPSPVDIAGAASFAEVIRSAGFGGTIVAACDLTSIELVDHEVNVQMPLNGVGGVWAPAETISLRV